MKRDNLTNLSDPALLAEVSDRAAAAVRQLRAAARDFAPVVFASSFGAEDMVLTDLIWRNEIDIGIFTLDTGRLPGETHDLIAAAERHYGRRFDIRHPEHAHVAHFASTHGINGFHASVEARQACCQARKVSPPARAGLGVGGQKVGTGSTAPNDPAAAA